MFAKTSRIAIKMLLVLFFGAMLFSGFAFAQDFDLSYSDPEGDVEDMEGITYSEGYEHIDILQISSSENILRTQLILEIMVSGVITDSEYITYTLFLMDGEDWIYMITYNNGACTGMDMSDGSTDILQASGEGTNTLEVRVQMSNLPEISNFDLWGEAYDINEASEQYLSDRVPDSGPGWDDDYFPYEMPVMITEPKPGATVSGTKIITGVTDPYYEMVSVEIQFDSESEQGWILTSTSDNWETWSYEWQSTNLPDGEHTLNARGYDGTEYHLDSITVYVDQSNAISPPTANVPTLKVGHELVYTMDMSNLLEEDLFEGMKMEMSSEMTMKVKKKESIEVNGTQYEAYAIDTTVSVSMTMTYEGETMSMSTTADGTQWLRVSDLATLKSDMVMETSYSGMDMSDSDSQESITTYDPPMDSYNFPMSIAETWTSSCTVTTEEIYDNDGEPDSWETSSESSMEYEALHVEDVTVPAGTYETFIIWSLETSEDYMGGGTPFFGSSSGYVLSYYSPEIGFPVKSEYYYPNRELYMSVELISYREAGSEPGQGPGSFGGDLPIYLLLIPILIAIILASVMTVRSRRRRAAAIGSWDQYIVGSEIPTQAYQPFGQTYQTTAPVSQAYPLQTGQVYAAQPSQPQIQQSQVYNVSTTQAPQSRQPYKTHAPGLKVQQIPTAPQPSPALIPPQPKTEAQQPVIYATKISKPYPPPPPQKLQRTSQYPQQQTQQPVIPLIQTKCPRCSNLFFVQKGAARAQCPNCGISGKMQW